MLSCIACASLLAMTLLELSFANPTLEDSSQSKSSHRRSRLEAQLFGRQYCTYSSCALYSCSLGYYCSFSCCFPSELICSPVCSYDEICENGICVYQGSSSTSSDDYYQKKRKISGGAIGGIAGGGLGGVAILAGIILLWWRKRKTSSAMPSNDQPAYTADQGENYELTKEPQVHVSSVPTSGPQTRSNEITPNTIRPLAYSLEPQRPASTSSPRVDINPGNPGFPFGPQPYPNGQDSGLGQQRPVFGQEQSFHHLPSQRDFQPAEVPGATPGSDLHYVPIERIESELPGISQSPPPRSHISPPAAPGSQGPQGPPV